MTISVARKALYALGGLLRGVLGIAMWAAGIPLCAITLPRAGAPFTAMALTAILIAVAVWLHEGGHYLGARIMRMRVLRVSATFVDIVPQRLGFRWRLHRPREHKLAGIVCAVPAPNQPMRPAFLVFAAGGPVANLLAAALVAVVAWLFWPSPPAGILLAFAAINTAMGLLNLVPHSTGHVSDGQQLLSWARGIDEYSAELASTRLLSLSVHGTTADALPPADLAELERQPLPAPLQALWFRTKAAQNRGDWDGTPALIEATEAQIQMLTRAQQTCLRPLIEHLRGELAFSEAMRLRDASPLRDPALPLDVAWLAPELCPRVEALRAALRGDMASCERALEDARRYAENEVDAASAPSEARIATALRERFGAAPLLPATSPQSAALQHRVREIEPEPRQPIA